MSLKQETKPGYQPVVIIGAGRSGTNMLRDILTSIDSVATWPCDEINYIWRRGQVSNLTDELEPESLKIRNRAYIRSCFDKIAKKYSAEFVVEKTCANSLRVDYVDKIIPEAKYIYIVRDGRDVVASAKKRWTSGIDIPYILKKVPYVPFSDLPYYAIRYLKTRINRLLSKENALSSWGPRYKGIDSDVKNLPIEEVCAVQWKNCVVKSDTAFQNLSGDKYIKIYYEDFVRSPVKKLDEILIYLNIPLKSKTPLTDRYLSRVSAKSVGSFKKDISSEKVIDITATTLKKHNYL